MNGGRENSKRAVLSKSVVLKLFTPSTTSMTNIKMQYKWLPTAPGVCVCVCVCVHCSVCVCTLDGLNAEHKFRVCHVTFSSTIHSKKTKKNKESVLILIRIFIIVILLKYSKYTV